MKELDCQEDKSFFQEEKQIKLLICQKEKSWLRKDNQRRDLFVKKKRLFHKRKIEECFSERDKYSIRMKSIYKERKDFFCKEQNSARIKKNKKE